MLPPCFQVQSACTRCGFDSTTLQQGPIGNRFVGDPNELCDAGDFYPGELESQPLEQGCYGSGLAISEGQINMGSRHQQTQSM